jgi:dihydrofolate synthase/folylpolyglutamate synthase
VARFLDLDQLFAYFSGFIDLERGTAREPLKLERMRSLCALAGNPQDSFATIHVAGSKGKGSVSAMLASVLDMRGLRTGLYTSPHVTDYRERMSLAGRLFPLESYLAAGEEAAGIVDDYLGGGPASPPSFFEILTLMAFLLFRRESCRWVVLETGLGGRLDSTNVVNSAASVLTPIELEHVEYLGDSIEAIAGEKAGIIKPGRPAFIARMRPEARQVMLEQAARLGSPAYDAAELTEVLRAEPGVEGTLAVLKVRGPDGWVELETRLALTGRIQAENAALASLALLHLFPDTDLSVLERGLGAARLPARFEILSTHPLVALDGAHTPDSCALVLETWLNLVGKGGTLVFGCALDKDAASMARILSSGFDRVIVCRPGDFKKSDPLSVFNAFAAQGSSLLLEEDPLTALRSALSRGGNVLVTGSFYLAAIARRLFLKAS